jgi:plastocyanin
MTRIRVVGVVVLLVLGTAAFAAATPARRSDDNAGTRQVVMRDDCDPNDPAWNAVGGCALKRGDVSFAEFVGELDSPLSAAVVGHQSWRNDPSYLKVRADQTVHVRNAGGRPHTFTEVQNFGGGKVPFLNEGLLVAPECPGSVDVPPGGSTNASGLAVGNHRFQCCIHPWMRELIKVKPRGEDDGD